MATTKQPEYPNYQPFTPPDYQPINAKGMLKTLLPTLSQYADVNIGKHVKAQGDLTRGAFDLQKELTPEAAQLRVDTNAKYSPQITQQYLDLIAQADPEFLSVRNKLGKQVSQGLDDGYELGDALSREIEQSIRKGQTARGNWLGPAPTAAEAVGKASAGIDLYNQRQAAATSFLSSRAPSDLFGQYGIMEGYQPIAAITPTGSYVDASIPANLATAEAQNRTNYNSTLFSAYAANTNAQMSSYDRQWDRYLYGQAVEHGLYQPLTMGGAGGGWGNALGGAATGALTGAASGAMMGAAAGGIGAIPGALIGALGGGLSGGLGSMS